MEIMSFLISVPAPYAHIICGWRDYKVVHLVVDLLQKLINLATHHYIIASVPCSGISFLGCDIPKIYRIKSRAKIFLFKIFIVEFKPS